MAREHEPENPSNTCAIIVSELNRRASRAIWTVIYMLFPVLPGPRGLQASMYFRLAALGKCSTILAAILGNSFFPDKARKLGPLAV